MQTRKISKDLTILFQGRVYRDKYGVLTPDNIDQEVLVSPWQDRSVTPGLMLHRRGDRKFMGCLYAELPPNRAIACERLRAL